jgi:hypothetical protein
MAAAPERYPPPKPAGDPSEILRHAAHDGGVSQARVPPNTHPAAPRPSHRAASARRPLIDAGEAL